MFARFFIIGAVLLLCAGAVTAQTQGQLLESAIFAEETAGDLDAAIRIYERLVRTPALSPEITTRARSRLSTARQVREQALRAEELAAQRGQPGRVDPPPPAAPTRPLAARYADMYDSASPVSVTGTVTEVVWKDPHVVIFLNSSKDGQPWGFVLAPPVNLERGGWTRDLLQVGEQVRAEGTLALGVGNCPAPLPNGCATFANGARHANARNILKIDANGNLTRPGSPVVTPAGVGGQRGGRGGGRGAAPPPQQ